MRKMNLFFVLISTLIVFSSFNEADMNISEMHVAPVSDVLEDAAERDMLNSINYIEEDENVVLGYDPYLYLPFFFNAYEGMELELNDIQYIELDEEDLLY